MQSTAEAFLSALPQAIVQSKLFLMATTQMEFMSILTQTCFLFRHLRRLY